MACCTERLLSGFVISQNVRMAPITVHLRNIVMIVVRLLYTPQPAALTDNDESLLSCASMQISAAGFFASIDFPVEQIDSPDFFPKASWAERCLRMCIPVMLFRFRYVRS